MEQLENHQQMVDACQIPEDVYKNMTTEELSQTILAYPLNADMFAYDTCEIGFDTVKEHFNGLQEFCERTDSVSYLIDLYSTQEVVLQSDLDEETVQAFQSDNSIAVTENGKEACKKIFNTLTLSLFLAQDTFVEKMTPVDEHNLANVIYEKNAVILQDLGESTSEITSPLRAAASPCKFVGFDSNYNGKVAVGTTVVQTPKGGSMTGYTMNAMEVWLYSDGQNRLRQLSDLSSSAKASLNTQYYNIYGIRPVSGYGPTVKYNCHSYAWYRQANCNYWINEFSTYGYTSVGKLDVNVGGKMVYYGSYNGTYTNITHSAVITDITYYPRSKVTFDVKSKWGMCGLYEHSWDNCPYFYINKNGCDLKYYNG